jgi:hypothetical protein
LKQILVALYIAILIGICWYCSYKTTPVHAKLYDQKFISEVEVMQDIKMVLNPNEKISLENVCIEYANMDEDHDLELLTSYRIGIHQGYFFIYDYKDGKYNKIFYKPWAVEKMGPFEVVVASGDKTVHQLTAHILHVEKGKVFEPWSGIIDQYDYRDPVNGIEIHGYYYVDTNAILDYCYKRENTNQDGKVLKSQFKEESYIWDRSKNKYTPIKVSP